MASTGTIVIDVKTNWPKPAVCPGCGRCRQCGQPPVPVVPAPYPYTPLPWWQQPRQPWYVGDSPNYCQVTC